MTTLIKSAVILDSLSPYHKQQKDILITNGVISKIANSIKENEAENIIKLDDLHVSTGWFDTSVSVGEPGFEERETIKNTLKVAAKSGFTAIAVNSNCNPIMDSKSDVEFLINQAKKSNVQAYPIAALSKESKGKDLAELFDMSSSGAIAFGDYNKAISNDNLMKIALLYAQNFDGLILSFPKNNSIAGEGIVNEGTNSTRLGLKGSPELAEHLQIARDLYLLEYTGGKLHIPTISTAKSVQLIKEAKKKGLKVSCSVAVENLVLTDNELEGFDSNFKINPPLRTNKDTKALIKGIKDGVIDIITSDHNPIDIENKKVEFSQALYGTIGLESLFGAVSKLADLEVIIESLTSKPRNVFGVDQPTIKEGEKANLSLFNPNPEYTFTKEHILSASKNSAFIGKKLKGIVYGTITGSKNTLNK